MKIKKAPIIRVRKRARHTPYPSVYFDVLKTSLAHLHLSLLEFFYPIRNQIKVRVGGGQKSRLRRLWSIFFSSHRKKLITLAVSTLTIMLALQVFLPDVLRPGRANASQNFKNWTTKADFQTALTNNQVTFGDESITLKSMVDYGDGSDCDVVITGTVNIVALFETSGTVTGANISNCSNPARNGSNKGLGHGAGAYNSAKPQFKNLTINNGGILVTSNLTELSFYVLESLTVNSGGSISADGTGYLGNGPIGFAADDAGIGYGTAGGDSTYYCDYGSCPPGGAGKGPYGAYPAQIDFGSGNTYDRGGGKIKIFATAMSISGSVTANAVSSYGGSWGGTSGGGMQVISSNNVSLVSFRTDGTSGRSGYYENVNYGADIVGGIGGVGRIFVNAPNNPSSAGSGVVTNIPLTYLSPGTLGGTAAGNTGLRVDNGLGSKTKYTSVEPTYSALAANEAVKFRLRVVVADANGNGPQDEFDNASTKWYGPVGEANMNDWTTNYFGYSNIPTDTNPANNNIPVAVPLARYAELMVRLESSTGASTPTLDSVKLNWNEAPTPSTVTTRRVSNNEAIIPGWINESSAKLVFNGTPTANGNVTPEVEVRSVAFGGAAPSFTGTPTVANIVAPAVAGTADAELTNLTAIISSLVPGNTYYWKSRYYDSAGVQSAWSSQTGVFSVEQESPSISAFTVSGSNVVDVGGNKYAKSQEVMLNVTATDNGTVKSSPTGADLYMQFSNNGSSWGTAADATTGNVTDTSGNCTGATKYWDGTTCWVQYQATNYPWNLQQGAKDGGTDGVRNVYVQVMDKAGNIAKEFQTSQADFNTGTPNSSNVSVNAGGYVELVSASGSATYSLKSDSTLGLTPDPTSYYDFWINADGGWNCNASAKVGTGAYVPFGGNYCDNGAGRRNFSIAVPAGGASSITIYQVGGDSLTTTFTLPAGKVFPAGQNLAFSIYTWGDNDDSNAWGGIETGGPNNSTVTGIVASQMPVSDYYTSKTFGGAGKIPTTLSWGSTEASGSRIDMQVMMGPNADASGGIGWTAVPTNGQRLSTVAGWQASYKYMKYRSYLFSGSSQTVSPKLNDVSVGFATSSTLTLDTTAPSVLVDALAIPNGGEKWKGGSTKTITWDTTKITDPNPGSNSGLKTAPVTLKYATDGTNYTNTIATGLTNGVNSGCTPGAGGGCYTWTLPASVGANSNNVKVQIIAEDNVTLTGNDVSDSAFALDTQAPTAVTDLAATLSGTTATKNPVSLLWSAATDTATSVKYYSIYRSTTNGQLGSKISTDGVVTGTTYSDTAPSDTTYYYTVRAVDDSSDGGNEQTAGNNQLSVIVDNQGPSDVTVNGYWDTSGNVISPNPNGTTYAKSANVRLNVTATETGGAGFAKYELSLDGNTWCNSTNISGNSFTSNNTDKIVAINLEDTNCGGVAGSGVKNVYIRFTDAAGNMSGKNFTTQGDWQAGTLSDLDATTYPGSLTRIPTVLGYKNATVVSYWAGSVVDIHFRKIGTTYYRLRSDYNVSDEFWHTYLYKVVNGVQTEIATDAIYWGDVPGEYFKIVANDATLTVSMGDGGSNWEERIWVTDNSISNPGSWATVVGSQQSFTPSSPLVISPAFGTLGETETALLADAGIGKTQKWQALSWNATPLESGQSIKYQISTDGTNWLGPDGLAGSWTNNYFGQVFGDSRISDIPSSLSASRYLYVKIRIDSNIANAPIIYDLLVNFSIISPITLDLHNPDPFSITGPTTQWSRTQNNPLFEWGASGDVIGIKEYWLWIDKNSNGVFDEAEKEVKSAATFSSNAAVPLSNGNHKWKVVAVDFAGNTTDSTQTTWTYGYDNLKPSAALGGQFGITAAYSNETITLEWSNKQLNSGGYTDTASSGSPTASYVIQRLKYRFLDSTYTVTSDNWSNLAGDPTSGYVEYTGIPYAPLSFVDDNTLPEDNSHYVQPSEKYTYRIRVIDTAGNISDWSNSTNWYKTSSTKDNVPPSYPESISATPGAEGFSVDLHIGIPANDSGVGTIGYKIYRTTVPDSVNFNDYALVGYFHATGALNLDYTDNDDNVVAEVRDTINVDTDGVITQEEIVTKPALSSAYKLNDHTTYYYRILGMDLMGNTFYLDQNGDPVYDVISKDRSVIPIVNDNRNRAVVTTNDITKPCWAHYNGPTLTSCDNDGSLDLSATGLDGIDDINDPKQKVEVSWATASDFNELTRAPAGTGLGVKSYSVSYAIGDINAPTGEFQTIDAGTDTSITISRLEPKPSYYWFKVIVYDNNNPSLSQITALEKVATLSNDYPNPPYYVNVDAVRGDPNAVNTRVGKDIRVTFVGSMIKTDGNFITGYKAYRTSDTNLTPVLRWQVSGLSIPGDTRDPGDGNCPSIVPPIAIDKQSNNSYGTRCFTDTIPVGEDARKYTYKIYAEGTNPDIDPTGTLTSQSPSSVNPNIQGYGWDIVPDATKPASVTGVRVKDIHPDQDPATPDITNEYRNIITWQRIATPTRYNASLGAYVNDFMEYRLYRSEDGLTYEQVCQFGLEPTCDDANPNLLRSDDPDLTKAENQEKSLGTNYYIDRLGFGVDANKEYYYKLVAVDDSGSEFLFSQGIRNKTDDFNIGGTPINTYVEGAETIAPYNISSVVSDSVDSLNPTTAWPTILPVNGSGTLKALITYRGVSSLTIHWHTDQNTGTLVEYRKSGTADPFVAAGDTEFKRDHTATIRGLQPGTEYEYKLYSVNKLGNVATATDSLISRYSVLPKAETEKFTITYRPDKSKMSTMSAEIHWSTNMPSNTNIIEYALANGNHNGSQAETPAVINEDNLGQYNCVSGTTIEPKLCEHSLSIAPLRTSSNYFVKIKAISLDGYVAYTDNLISLWTSESDSSKFTMTPETSNVADRNITATTAQIVWETAIPTKATVLYGTSAGARNLSVVDNQMTNRHVIQITGLTPGMRYYYVVEVEDINGFKYQSPEYSFKAVLKPKISNMQLKEVKPYSVTISWETNVETETLINWGKTAAYGEKKGTQGMSKAHELKIEGLEDNTEYHYQVLAKDETGNEVADTDKNVRTPLDTQGPIITGVKTDILPIGADEAAASVIISWQTDKPGTTLVEYDEGIIGGKYTQRSIEDKSLNTSHTVILKDLKPAASYHFKIISKDKRGNLGQSPDHTFVTPTKEKSILQLILKSLEETFAWTKNIGKFFSNIGKRMTGK